jgi:hypothetical protein
MTPRLRCFLGFGAALALALSGRSAPGSPAGPPQTADEAAEILTTRFSAERRSIVRIKMDGLLAYRTGRLDAPITMLEFSDFGCSRCRAFHLATFPRIESALIKPGLVLYVSLNYYLHSPDGAKAALAAGSLGKYWEMKDLLNTGDGVLVENDYVGFARELQLNPAAFLAAYHSDKVAKEVELEKSQGLDLGVAITPTFVIGWRLPDGTFIGARISGPKPWTFFRDLVDQMIHE